MTELVFHDDATNACGNGRSESPCRVLDHERLIGADSEPIECSLVGVCGGLGARVVTFREDKIEIGRDVTVLVDEIEVLTSGRGDGRHRVPTLQQGESVLNAGDLDVLSQQMVLSRNGLRVFTVEGERHGVRTSRIAICAQCA